MALLAPGDLIADRYEITAYLNEGGMQEVYLARDHRFMRAVVCKIPKNSSAKKRFKRSAITSARINHPNVAKTLDYWEDESRPVLVEEYVLGGDLSTALKVYKVLDPHIVSRLFHEIARGIEAAHVANIVHRDMKPSNVLISDTLCFAEVKISDFGIAKMAEEELAEAFEGGDESMTASKTLVGALPYMAPETIEDPRAAGQFADIWSIGAMVYELLSGEKPFGTGLAAVKRITSGTNPPRPKSLDSCPQLAELAANVFDVCAQCMSFDANKRPNAKELLSLTERFCYSVEPRYRGEVHEYRRPSYGFIHLGDGEEVFFHIDSVYGARPAVGEQVVLSKFAGGGRDRAHPIVALR